MFIENRGQWMSPAQFIANAGDLSVCLLPDAVALRALDPASGQAAVVRFVLSESRDAIPVGEEQQPGSYNYFVGNDPARWRSDVRGYSSVSYPEIQAGVGLRLHGEAGVPTLTFCFAGGTPSESATIRLEGIDSLIPTADGSVLAETAFSPIRIGASARQLESGVPTHSVIAWPQISGKDALRFFTADRDVAQSLVINVGLEWGTFLGGSNTESSARMCVSPTGDVVVTCGTHSSDFPLTPGVVDTTIAGSNEVGVSRLNSSGSELVFSTFLGGSSGDSSFGVAVGGDEAITVFGLTSSPDFPTTPTSFDTELGFFTDLFVTRLSANGQALLWSTYLGGDKEFGEQAGAMALCSDNSVYVVGKTQDGSYPVTPGAYQTIPDNPGPGTGSGDIVVSHISADGTTLLHSTFLRGSGVDSASGVACMPDGVVVVGHSDSPDFPVSANAYDSVLPGGIVAKLDLTLSQLVFSTVLSAHEPGAGGPLTDVAVDPSGNVTVVGYTNASTWPTTPGVVDPTYSGQEDIVVTKLNPIGSSLIYSTYLGAGSREGAMCAIVDSAGTATIGGFTDGSPGFPTTPGAWDTTPNGNWDGFVLRLSPNAQKVWYGTYLGGASLDSPQGDTVELAERPDGTVVVASRTYSSNFPVTPGAYDTTYSGTPTTFSDLYVAQLSMLPTGVGRCGASTEGCAGYLAMGVTAMPQLGKPFAMTCRNAPASSTQGILAVGASDLSQPLMAKGAQFWVDPTPILLLLPMISNAVGFASLGGTLPNAPGLPGTTITVQCFWPDACAPSGPISASNALSITIQP